MLWFVCFFNYADRQAIFSVFTPLKAQFGLTDVQLGVIASSFMWLYALCGPLAGWIADRAAAKWIVIGALAFWSAATAATACAHGYVSLVVLRALGGASEALYYPAAMSLVGAYHGPATRSRAMAFHQSSVYVGTIAGGALSGAIAQRWGWHSSFLLLGACGVVLAVILSFALQQPAAGAAEPEELALHEQSTNIRDIFRNRSTVMLILIFIGANFVAMLFLTWLPTYLLRAFHMGLAKAGFNATVYLQVASIAGVMIGGVAADRLARSMCGGRQLVQAAGLAIGFPFIVAVGQSTSTKVVLLAMVGFGIGKGLYDSNIWASLYDTVPQRLRGAATGWMNSLGWLGGGLAPLAVAAAANHIGFGACFAFSGLIYLGLALAMLWISRQMTGKSSSRLERSQVDRQAMSA